MFELLNPWKRPKAEGPGSGEPCNTALVKTQMPKPPPHPRTLSHLRLTRGPLGPRTFALAASSAQNINVVETTQPPGTSSEGSLTSLQARSGVPPQGSPLLAPLPLSCSHLPACLQVCVWPPHPYPPDEAANPRGQDQSRTLVCISVSYGALTQSIHSPASSY